MDIKHDVRNCKFYVEIKGHVSYVSYVLTDTELDICRTVVPKAVGGQGIASALVKAAFDYAHAQGLKFIATCSYAADWKLKHLLHG